MTVAEETLLFVYGTLRPSLAKGLAADRLRQEARHLGPATAQGRLHIISWYPGLVETDALTDRVIGDVFALPDSGDLLEAMDAYEEINPDTPTRNEYVRVKRPVEMADGVREAWIYVFQQPVAPGTVIPDGDFATYVAQQARRDGV